MKQNQTLYCKTKKIKKTIREKTKFGGFVVEEKDKLVP
jgi:hypothetical protein